LKKIITKDSYGREREKFKEGDAILDRPTHGEKVFWTHGSELGERLDGEDGREEVVALLQHVLEERRPRLG
jgi:hypothetical protein